MIKSDNVIFRYNHESDDYALNKLNIEIEKGSFTGIIGHNGSGKSTFAKLANAIHLPEGGAIYVAGMDTLDDDLIWKIRKNAGLVFQNPDNQIVATIVEEDVAFGPENLGVPTTEIRQRVDMALESVGMTKYAKKPPHLLSGGQKQRIAIAGVLAMQPECIILDEPTAMLDPIGRREVLNTIKSLNKQNGITIVHITHYMDEVVDADKVIVIQKGEKWLEGKPSEVFSKVDILQDIGLDVPQVTLLAHELRKEGFDLPIDILTVEEMESEICRLLSKI